MSSNEEIKRIVITESDGDTSNPDANIGIDSIRTERGEIEVSIDIKPGSYPNCFNVNGHGLLPVAVLGSATFDVMQIDVNSLVFAGLKVRVRGNENPQCSIVDVSGDFTEPNGAPDGILDLVCQFVDDPSVWAPGDGTAELAGSLQDGTDFTGTDSICVVP